MSKTFDYISIRDTADKTGYTDSRIRQLLRAKVLEGKKTGPRNWLVKKSEIPKLKRRRAKLSDSLV